jgi:hypothetical protein
VVAFITGWVVFLAGIGLVRFFMARRPIGAPLTWGEAMVAATFVFGMMLLSYAIIPNVWLQWASDELQWRADATAYELEFFGRGQIIITKQVIRDIIIVVIYGVMLGLQVYLWSAWQNRGKKAAPAIESSAFGRPLVKRS